MWRRLCVWTGDMNQRCAINCFCRDLWPLRPGAALSEPPHQSASPVRGLPAAEPRELWGGTYAPVTDWHRTGPVRASNMPGVSQSILYTAQRRQLINNFPSVILCLHVSWLLSVNFEVLFSCRLSRTPHTLTATFSVRYFNVQVIRRSPSVSPCAHPAVILSFYYAGEKLVLLLRYCTEVHIQCLYCFTLTVSVISQMKVFAHKTHEHTNISELLLLWIICH